MQPYNNLSVTEDCILREFDENIDLHELMWHRDLHDRTVTVLEGHGWFFQLDNQLPVELKQDTSVFIPKMQWHRVLKGTSTLKLQIQE
jgi:quercetin dioxygenase-like cupin family protein